MPAKHWINFGSGPAALPQEVLQEASEAILDYKNCGLSVLELPHRGELFVDILEEAKWLVKDLCGLGEDYEVLWLHGGGRLQFSMIPMNFLGAEESAGYIDSGFWSAEAARYARYYGRAEILCSSRETGYRELPELPYSISPDNSYVHITTNNTIYGTQWQALPSVRSPLIADMSSDILSRKQDYRRCAVFYAVAQKNIGTSGTTLVVIRRDMLEKIRRALPPMLDFREHIKKRSVLNTPPVFAIYCALLMLRWTRKKGMDQIEQESITKSEMLYRELERNRIFQPVVTVPQYRSRMNVCFRANNSEIEKQFSDFCNQHQITGIEGHRTVSGFRASLYNAVAPHQVAKLVSVMQEFEHIQNTIS